MQSIKVQAAEASAESRTWVKNYMGSSAVRSRLDPSLQHYSNEELLEAFIWQFKHLAVFHNAPDSPKDLDFEQKKYATDSKDVSKRVGVDNMELRAARLEDSNEHAPSGPGETDWHLPPALSKKILEAAGLDDTDLSVTLRNGYLQNSCARFVLGGDQTIDDLYRFMDIATRRFNVSSMEALTSLRKANDCVLYNSNNIRFTSAGHQAWGAFTYVLNAPAMQDRLFWEAWDSGLTEWYHTNSANHSNSSTLPVYPAFGTRENFLHLVKPHEELWNLPAPPLADKQTCCNYSLASLLNRWLVPGTPAPTAANAGSIWFDQAPYYEVITMGNMWLPEDLLFGIAQFTGTHGKSARLFGTQEGDDLRAFCIRNKRPLVWTNADDDDSPMLIDPIVGNIAGGRITAKDKELFSSWRKTDAEGFQQLAAAAPSYLHFKHQSYPLRHVCAVAELDSRKQVMGTDGENNCVYWELSSATVSDKWERINDGACVQSQSERAVHASKAECLSTRIKWTCVANVSSAAHPGAHYCVPSPHGAFGNADVCEARCGQALDMSRASAQTETLQRSASEHAVRVGGWAMLLVFQVHMIVAFASLAT